MITMKVMVIKLFHNHIFLPNWGDFILSTLCHLLKVSDGTHLNIKVTDLLIGFNNLFYIFHKCIMYVHFSALSCLALLCLFTLETELNFPVEQAKLLLPSLPSPGSSPPHGAPSIPSELLLPVSLVDWYLCLNPLALGCPPPDPPKPQHLKSYEGSQWHQTQLHP